MQNYHILYLKNYVASLKVESESGSFGERQKDEGLYRKSIEACFHLSSKFYDNKRFKNI
jgi:hypothetical protein